MATPNHVVWGKMLEAVVRVLKKRFNNLTTEETVALATELIHVMVEATPKEE